MALTKKKYFSIWIDTLQGGNRQYYYVKDTEAQAAIAIINQRLSHVTNIIGFTSTQLNDGDTTSTLTPVFDGSLTKTTGFVTGDLVYYRPAAVNGVTQPTHEFICLNVKTSEDAPESLIWCEFGSTGSLGFLAFKDAITLTYTPKGNVSVSLQKSATKVINGLTGGRVTLGTQPAIQDGFLNPGKPTEVLPGNLPTLTCEYDGNEELLSLLFNPGTQPVITPGTAPSLDSSKFQPGTPTKVVLPTPTEVEVLSDVIATGTFTGEEETVNAQ